MESIIVIELQLQLLACHKKKKSGALQQNILLSGVCLRALTMVHRIYLLSGFGYYQIQKSRA